MNYKIVAITDTQYYEENFSLKKLAAKVALSKRALLSNAE